MIKRIRSNTDNKELQLIIDNLHAGAEWWQMYINVNKCKVVHLAMHAYEMIAGLAEQLLLRNLDRRKSKTKSLWINISVIFSVN